MATMRPNWKHDCITNQANACCTLLCVVGKLDIYYAHAIHAYVVRFGDDNTMNFSSISKLRSHLQDNPKAFPGLLAAIEMDGLE